MSVPPEREYTVEATDGVRLRVRLRSPARPRAVLLLCHGLTSDLDEHGAFPALSRAAADADFASVRFDFRAHGQSQGEIEYLRLAGMRADAEAVEASLATELGDRLPVIPVGLSFGGIAAVHLAALGRAAGLVLWYPVIDGAWNYGERSPMPFTQAMWAARRPDDPEWAATPIPGGPFFLPRGLLDELRTDPTPAHLVALTVPTLAFHGTRDRFVGVTPLRTIARDHPLLEMHSIRGAGHGFILNRARVIRKTVRWAAAHTAPRSGGQSPVHHKNVSGDEPRVRRR